MKSLLLMPLDSFYQQSEAWATAALKPLCAFRFTNDRCARQLVYSCIWGVGVYRVRAGCSSLVSTLSS